MDITVKVYQIAINLTVVQQLFQTNKIPDIYIVGPVSGESTGDCWIPLIKGQ